MFLVCVFVHGVLLCCIKLFLQELKQLLFLSGNYEDVSCYTPAF